MNTEDIFELFLLENEGLFKYSLLRSIGILTPKITQYQDSEINLLLHLHAGEYIQFIDALAELMVKELNFRIGEDGFDTEPLQVLRHEIEYEIGSKKVAFYQTSQPMAYKKECLDQVLSFVAGLKGKTNGELELLQCIGIFELLNEVFYFFGSDDLSEYDGAFGYFLLALDSDPEELQSILDGWIKKLSVEEKERAAETVLVWYMYNRYTDDQNESLEYCFEGVWQQISLRNRERLIIQFNKLLHDAPDEVVFFAWQLLSGVDVFIKLSESIKRQHVNAYFSYPADLLQNPDSMDLVISELQLYGLGMLEEKNYKPAAKLILNFYLEFGGLSEDELKANELEAVHLVPGLLYNSSPKFLECFRKQLQLFVSAKKKYPEERNRLVVMNDLIAAVNEREDVEEEEKWELVEVF